jgi:hypothetical protein
VISSVPDRENNRLAFVRGLARKKRGHAVIGPIQIKRSCSVWFLDLESRETGADGGIAAVVRPGETNKTTNWERLWQKELE